MCSDQVWLLVIYDAEEHEAVNNLYSSSTDEDNVVFNVGCIVIVKHGVEQGAEHTTFSWHQY